MTKQTIVTSTRTALLVSVLGGLIAVIGLGCDQAADCYRVCNRYQSCFDAEYDVDACQSRCNDKSSDEQFRARTNECDACISERSCTDSIFACGSECADVINN